MVSELLSKISNLIPYGYYDKSKDMITVHFFSKDGDKADIMAYLKRNMSWDIREVVEEKATLLWDREVVEIIHSSLGVCEKDSRFDKMIRSMLFKIEAENSEDTRPFRERNKMFRILEDNKYDD